MKYSSFIVSGFRKEGRDYPDWGTIMSLNERRYLSSIDWFWKDHNALHLLLHEKRFAEKMACKAKNYKVCDYIYVYVGESDKTGTISDINVETAPYYIGDEVEMKNNNPFGWMK